MRLLKPQKLLDGDTIGVIAPSHPVLPHQEKYDQGIKHLKKFGFNVKEGKTVKLCHRNYMAGTDLQRAEDFNDMFADEEVKAIICALGGSVAIRTVPYLDYDLIRKNPKIFSGMSDITTLHVAFLARAGLTGLHQADVCFGFGADQKSEEAKFETELFFEITQHAEPLGLLPALTKWEVWREGEAEGRLFGGNIGSIERLLATPYFPELDENLIFFWEGMAAPLEELDPQLAHLRESGLFEKTKGMIIGKIRGEEPDPSSKLGYKIRDMTAEIKELVLDVTMSYDFPIIAGVDFGHYTPNVPLPLGIKAAIDTDGAKVSLNESYVE
jgi:muramoyltetrapeptide carboxypeptidase